MKNDNINSQVLTPPNALDFEDVIIGALLLEEQAMVEAADKLKPQMFYSASNRLIYEVMLNLFNDGNPIDIITVVNALRKVGKIDEVGGAYHITNLTNRVASSANIEYHIAIISEKYLKRELIKACREAERACYDEGEDVFDVISKVDLKKDELLSEVITKREITNEELFKESLIHFETSRNKKSEITGIESGFSDLDRITAGWQKTDLIIIAARPAMGKTSFVIQCVLNAAKDFSRKVAFFSLEMNNRQLMNKQISITTEIPLENFRKNRLSEFDFQKIHRKAGEISNSKIFWDDTSAISITEIKAKAKKLHRREGIELIVIDYMQLITTPAKSRSNNREQEIALISRSLKALAKDLDLPVIVLSQLSRNVESRANKTPLLSDLRESGSIEQDADLVLFLHRPEYYGQTEYPNGISTAGKAEVIIAKHRNGATDDIMLNWIGETTSFKDLDYLSINEINNQQEETKIF
ncbi:replicative DNA helicase [Pedobacter lithocola]|uniref:Replicative DNA helicase n=1 Tax=Pedobacter lithocola TaxID=1908239 RepID=A0ABV8PA33_9SPHI